MEALRYIPFISLPPKSIAMGEGAFLYTLCESKRGKALGEAQKPAKVGSPFLTQAAALPGAAWGALPPKSAKVASPEEAAALAGFWAKAAACLLAAKLGGSRRPLWKAREKGRKGNPNRVSNPRRKRRNAL